MDGALPPVTLENVCRRMSPEAQLPVPGLWIAETVFDGGFGTLHEFGFRRLGSGIRWLPSSDHLRVDLPTDRTVRLLQTRRAAAPPFFDGSFDDASPAWLDRVVAAGVMCVIATPRPHLHYPMIDDLYSAACGAVFQVLPRGTSADQ